MNWLPYRDAFPGAHHTVSGDVRVMRGISSHGLAPRELLVYLPPGHGSSPARRYPVLYLHDGQNCFDEATSFAGEWGADEAAEALAARGREAILVAIPNAGAARLDEYGPWRHEYPWMGPVGGLAPAYLDFLLETVKPLVDRSFSTLPGREHTGIAGSSMGGLVSLFVTLTRPEVFGFCAALSPSLWFAEQRIFSLARPLTGPAPRVYLDIGWFEAGNPFEYTSHLRSLRRLRARLHEAGLDVVHREDVLGRHGEEDWRQRFPQVLEWFLVPEARPPARVPLSLRRLTSRVIRTLLPSTWKSKSPS